MLEGRMLAASCLIPAPSSVFPITRLPDTHLPSPLVRIDVAAVLMTQKYTDSQA